MHLGAGHGHQAVVRLLRLALDFQLVGGRLERLEVEAQLAVVHALAHLALVVGNALGARRLPLLFVLHAAQAVPRQGLHRLQRHAAFQQGFRNQVGQRPEIALAQAARSAGAGQQLLQLALPVLHAAGHVVLAIGEGGLLEAFVEVHGPVLVGLVAQLLLRPQFGHARQDARVAQQARTLLRRVLLAIAGHDRRPSGGGIGQVIIDELLLLSIQRTVCHCRLHERGQRIWRRRIGLSSGI